MNAQAWVREYAPSLRQGGAGQVARLAVEVAGAGRVGGSLAPDAAEKARNHYDRMVHFSFGLLMAYPVRELFVRVARVRAELHDSGLVSAAVLVFAFAASGLLLEYGFLRATSDIRRRLHGHGRAAQPH